MKKLTKKLLSLGLIAILATGCSTNSVETPNKSNTSVKEEVVKEKAETATKEEQPEASQEELPFPEYRNENGEIDLKGETVKVLWAVPEESDGWIEYFEQTYNAKVEIEFADWGDVVNKLTASVASGDPADITFIYASWYPRHITANLLEPVDKYLPLAESLRKEDDTHYFSEEEMEYFKWRGENYVFTTEDGAVDMAFYYNTAMLDEAGLEYPYDLEQRGEWNWDKLLEYAQILTVDKDGDGTTDQYGLESRDLFSMLLTSNDTDVVRVPREANDPPAGLTFDDPKTLNSLTTYEKIVTSGNISNDAQIALGTAAMAFRGADLANELTRNFTADGWGFCGAPKGPDNTSGKNASMHTSGWAIVKGSKNPVAATVALHCMLNRPEGKYISASQEEALPFSGFKSQEDHNRMKDYMMNSNKDIYHIVGWDGFEGKIGTVPLATAIEEMKPVLEETLRKAANEK